MIFACADFTIGITLPQALRDDPILSNLGNTHQQSERHIKLDILDDDNGIFAIKFGSRKVEAGFKRGALLRRVLALIDESFGVSTLNASAVAMNDRAAIFVGYGKSSIAAWLIEKGFTYVADQKIALGEKLYGLASPLQFDWATHLAALPNFGSAPMVKLGERFFIAPKPEWHTPQPVHSGVVIFLNHIEDAKLCLEKIQAAEAISLLRKNQTGIDDTALTRLAHHTPTITLTYSSFDQLDGVLDLLLQLALGKSMSPVGFDKFVTFMPQAPMPQLSKSPIPARSDRVIPCKLTIGMATYDDYDGVYFSIQAMRLYHPEILADVEFIIIDNHPDGPCAEELKKLETAIPNLRYIPVNDVVGTTIKERVFTEANGEFVLCMDCHVMFAPGSLKRLLDYFAANPTTIDLHHGPMISDDLKTLTTQWKTDQWSSGMLGKWHTDIRGLKADNPPFEIDAHGMGIFACRKAAWPSFNADFRGFGGEEVYMHGKFRARGGKILCLPFLIWLHRFGRPMGIKYPNNWEDRIRNALIGFDELGWDTTDMITHFQELLGKDVADKAIADVYSERGWNQAADVSPKTDFCAVSGFNGKVNIHGGVAGNNNNNADGAFGAYGSLSAPIGCDFGLQLDAGFQQEMNSTTFGGVAHAFTRDPNTYLLGITGGYFDGAGSNVWAVGPEAEFYAGQFSFEAWGGFAKVDVNGLGSTNDGFVFADAAYYPVDDLRLSVGATIVGDSRFLRAAMEYQVADPISLNLNAKIGEDDYVAVNAGLTFYFGGSGSKSLIRRHREDDPRNRLIDIQGVNQTLTTHAQNRARANATTVAPTTMAPTTMAPTTVAPTTMAPTTVAPTTMAPTTMAPTTVAPTTMAPTTPPPTTCSVDPESPFFCGFE